MCLIVCAVTMETMDPYGASPFVFELGTWVFTAIVLVTSLRVAMEMHSHSRLFQVWGCVASCCRNPRRVHRRALFGVPVLLVVVGCVLDPVHVCVRLAERQRHAGRYQPDVWFVGVLGTWRCADCTPTVMPHLSPTTAAAPRQFDMLLISVVCISRPFAWSMMVRWWWTEYRHVVQYHTLVTHDRDKLRPNGGLPTDTALLKCPGDKELEEMSMSPEERQRSMSDRSTGAAMTRV